MTDSQITLSWKTYSPVEGRVLFREKGQKNFITVKSNLKHGASAGVYRKHHAILTNLKAGKTYEYQVQTLDPQSEKWQNYEDDLQSFTLPERKPLKMSVSSFIKSLSPIRYSLLTPKSTFSPVRYPSSSWG